jgi:adenosylhomocysteine nucleosidase
MKEEVLLLQALIDEPQEERRGCRTFYSGQVGQVEVVLCLSGWGKVAAAATVAAMVERYDITHLFFIGLAGALQPEMNVGDLVVAKSFAQYDVNLASLKLVGKVQPPYYKKFEFRPDSQMYLAVRKAARLFAFKNRMGRIADMPGGYYPVIWRGQIVTGDRFIAAKEDKAAIMERFPDALCAEMEGAAIAQVASEYGLKFAVLRIISDCADEQASKNFNRFLLRQTGRISMAITKLLIANLA